MKTWRIDQLLHFYLIFEFWVFVTFIFVYMGPVKIYFYGPTHVVHSGLQNTRIEIWTKATSLNSQYTFLESRHSEGNENANYVVSPEMSKKKAYSSWVLFPKKL